MSLFDTGVRGAGEVAWARVVRVGGMARRISPAPALVRTGATVAAMAATTLAVPLDVLSSGGPTLSRILGVLAVVSVGVGLFPRTRWVSLVALATVLGWLLSTLGYGDPVEVPRLGALVTALFAMHTAAALAAVLPYDCVVAPAVLVRWLARSVAVLAVGLVVGLGGMMITNTVPSSQTVIGPIIGAVVAACLAGLLAWLLRRR